MIRTPKSGTPDSRKLPFRVLWFRFYGFSGSGVKGFRDLGLKIFMLSMLHVVGSRVFA